MGGRWMGDDPEALVGMMDDGDVLLADRSHRIGLAVEFDGEVGVETALEVNGQVEVQEAAAGSAGRFGLEGLFVGQPSMAEAIELGWADHQSLGGGGGIQLAEIESGQDILHKEGGNTVEELLFFS